MTPLQLVLSMTWAQGQALIWQLSSPMITLIISDPMRNWFQKENVRVLTSTLKAQLPFWAPTLIKLRMSKCAASPWKPEWFIFIFSRVLGIQLYFFFGTLHIIFRKYKSKIFLVIFVWVFFYHKSTHASNKFLLLNSII